VTGPQTGQSGAQASQTGPLTSPAAVSVMPSVISSAAAVDVSATVSHFGGVTDMSKDIYHDYIGMVTGSQFDASTITWRLARSATPAEFQLWESHIDSGFAICKAFDSSFGGQSEFDIAYRRVDDVLADRYHDFLIVEGIIGLSSSWADFKQFLHARFRSSP
jgi:hypothetical protein